MANSTRTTKRCRRRGVTLAESLMATTILAASVIGITGPLLASNQQAEILQQNGICVSLAQQLMEEIASKPFYDPVNGTTTLGIGASQTTRTNFNNVGDYDTYTDRTTSLKTQSGTSMSFPSGGLYTRLVHVEYRTTPNGASVSTGNYALVQVTVTAPMGAPVVLSRLISNVPWAP